MISSSIPATWRSKFMSSENPGKNHSLHRHAVPITPSTKIIDDKVSSEDEKDELHSSEWEEYIYVPPKSKYRLKDCPYIDFEAKVSSAKQVALEEKEAQSEVSEDSDTSKPVQNNSKGLFWNVLHYTVTFSKFLINPWKSLHRGFKKSSYQRKITKSI